MILQALQGAGESVLRRVSLVSDHLRQPDVLTETAHRPWPAPERPWLMGQTWTDLLFAHWRVPPVELERVVPPQLPLDTFDGSAWIGITPFLVEGLRLRGTAPIPWISSFPEINVRTYVSFGGKPGIFFLSLDTSSRAAVQAARRSYRLPYFRSQIRRRADIEGISFDSRRISADGPPACFEARYGPAGELLPDRPDSLERWLSERYCLYTLDERRRVQRGEIHHPPWPLRPARAEIKANTMARPFDISLEGAPLLHFSGRQDVALWSLEAA